MRIEVHVSQCMNLFVHEFSCQICIYIYLNICIYVYIQTYISICTFLFTYIHVFFIYVYMVLFIYLCIYAWPSNKNRFIANTFHLATHKGGNPGHPTPAMTLAFVGHHFCKEWMRLGCHAFLNMLGSVESRTMVNRRMYVFISTSKSNDEENSCI